jgi:hypothetical protein
VLGVLGDAEERVSVAELMYVFAIFVAVAIAAAVLGLRLGPRSARGLLIGALVLAIASFGAYVLGMNYAHSSDAVRWAHDAANWIALGGGVGMYVASGVSGPALSKRPALALSVSVAATLLALTLGTSLMFGLACGLAGECL